MAHTYGAANARVSAATSPITSATFTPTSGSTCLVLYLWVLGATNRAGGAPTYNGVAMTQANSTQKAATTPESSMEIWYIVGANAAVAATAVIPNTGSLTISYAFATGKAGSGLTSVFDNAIGANGTSTNPSCGAMTVAAGTITFAGVASGLQTWSMAVAGGATQILSDDNGATGCAASYLLSAGGGSQTMSWTAGSDDWGAVAVSFKEATPPVTGIATPRAPMSIVGAVGLAVVTGVVAASALVPTASAQTLASSLFVTQNFQVLTTSYSSQHGTKFTVGAAPIVLTSLGHWVESPSVVPASMAVGLYADNGTLLTSVSGIVTTGLPGRYAWGVLSTPFVCQPLTSYWLMSEYMTAQVRECRVTAVPQITIEGGAVGVAPAFEIDTIGPDVFSLGPVNAIWAPYVAPVLQVELLEGATVRATWNVTPGAVVTSDLALTTPQRDAITNWGNLRVRLTKNNNQVDVFDVALTAPGSGAATVPFDIIQNFSSGSGALDATKLEAGSHGADWGAWGVVDTVSVDHTVIATHDVSALTLPVIAVGGTNYTGTEGQGATFDHSASPDEYDAFELITVGNGITDAQALMLVKFDVVDIEGGDFGSYYHNDIMVFAGANFSVSQFRHASDVSRAFVAHVSGNSGQTAVPYTNADRKSVV